MDRVGDVLAHHVTLDRNAERTPYRLLLVDIMAGAIHAIDPAEPSRLATVRLGTWVSAIARALAGSVFAVVPGVRGLAGPVARLITKQVLVVDGGLI